MRHLHASCESHYFDCLSCLLTCGTALMRWSAACFLYFWRGLCSLAFRLPASRKTKSSHGPNEESDIFLGGFVNRTLQFYAEAAVALHRAFLLERGLVLAQSPAKLKAAMADVLENADADLTPMMRNPINVLSGELKLVEQQLDEINDELERICAADAGCTRIRQTPGIGPVVATAIVAAIGNGAASTRDGSSPPGLASCRASTPREARRTS